MSSSSSDNIAKAVAEVKAVFPDIDDRLMSYVCDITKLSMVESWIAETIKRFGKIDACANVSGRWVLPGYCNANLTTRTGKEQRRINTLTDISLEDWHDSVDVNLHGMFHLLREEMKVISEGGSIVNVASVSSKYASAGYGAYIASKHGLAGLTKAAAFEGAPRGVRVNAICP